MLRILILHFFILVSVTRYTQAQVSLEGTLGTGTYRFQQISLDEGLLHNNVHALFEDKEGFIWIGSAGGLQRYDGEKFKNYTFGLPDKLTSGNINAITQAADGAIWISVEKNGLFRLLNEQFTHYTHDSNDSLSLPYNFISTVVPNADTSLWIGTAGGGLAYYKNEKFYHYTFPQTSNHVRAIHKNADGSLWLGISWSGLFHFKEGAHKAIPSVNRHPKFDQRVITQIITKTDGNLIMCAERNGLFGYNILKDSAYHLVDAASHAMNLAQNKNGTLWVGTWDNLYRYHGGHLTEIKQNYGDQNGLSSKVIYASMIDKHGRLWVGTYGGGVNVLLDHGFKSIKYLPESTEGLKYRVVKALLSDDEGTLWVAMMDNGICTYKNGIVNQFPDVDGNEELLNNNFYTIYMDSQGIEWFCGPSGLYKHENGIFSKIRSYKERDAQTIVEQSPGVYWVGSFHNGLSKYENGEFTYYQKPADPIKLRKGKILTMAMNSPEELWIGYHQNGVDVVQDEKLVRSFYHIPEDSTSLSNNRVTCIFKSADRSLWIGTSYGLNKYNSQSHTFERYFTKDGIISNSIQGINEDANGHLWISTINGISKLNPQTKQFTNYNVEDGIDTHPFSYYCTAKDKTTGLLYFGGENGVTTFHPDSVSTNVTVATTEILELKVLDKSISEYTLSEFTSGNDILKLDHEKDVISVSYISPNSNSANYAYMLEGLETRWNEVGGSKNAIYTKLPPGHYTFKVKAKTKNSPWGLATSIPIVIHPPYWQTWWFRTLLVSSIVLSVLIVFRQRVKNIKKRNILLQKEIDRRQLVQEELESKNSELERFTYTVSHDLKSPLITIRGFLGLIKEDIQQNDLAAVESDVLTIENATEKMGTLLNDLLEISRIGRIDGESVTIETNELISQVLKLLEKNKGKQSISFNVEPELPAIKGDRTRIFEVFQNLIGNAIKYMGDSEEKIVKIGYKKLNGNSTFYVSDTGIGIDPKFSNKVFDLFERLQPEIEGSGVGLAIVKRVIEVHNGKIWVESDGIGKGSTFYFTLPTV